MTPEIPPDNSRPADPVSAVRAVWRWGISLFVLPADERRAWPFENAALWRRLGLRWRSRRKSTPEAIVDAPIHSLQKTFAPAIRHFRQRATGLIDRCAARTEAWSRFAAWGPWTLAMLCVLGCLGFAATPLTIPGQVAFGVALLTCALLVRETTAEATLPLLMGMSMLATSRYIYWRATMTLGTPGSAEWWTALGLLFAEAYTWVVLFLGYLQNARPLKRPRAELPLDPASWPTVDVFIPTYNEPLSVVRPTIQAALSLDWPTEHLQVYVLDDGQRPEFRAFSAAVGATYVTREDRAFAKAGNLNHALGCSTGEFVAIFDCDHVPVRSFLKETMGSFVRDPRCALVQTPHHFFSPDPFERNLGTFRKVPGEGSLFYGLVQDGNDLWNAAYFCGSGAVLRRTALTEIGGIAQDTVTEDAHTALRLHRAGYTSAYVNTILAAGLATESLSDHVAQRVRWARGMAQIFRLDNPLLGRGLHWAQRLCYLSAMLHFFSGLPRLVFLTAPLAYLFFEFHVLNAGTVVLAAYALPHLFQAAIANSTLQRQYRHSLWNEAYEAALSWYTSLPTLWALIHPRHGLFNVTAKGGLIEHSHFDWRLALPYLGLVALNLVGVVIAVPRFLYWNSFEAETVVVNLVWTLFNLTLLGTVLGVASETRQVRRAHRIDARLSGRLLLPDHTVLDATVVDFSTGGLRLIADALPEDLLKSPLLIEIDCAGGRQSARVTGRGILRSGNEVRVELDPMDPPTERLYIEATFAHPQLWSDWHADMPPDRPLRSLAEVLSFGLAGYVRVAGLLGQQIRRRLQRPSPAEAR